LINEPKTDALKEKLKTSLAYSKNLFKTGAFSPTSRKTENEVCAHVPTAKGVTVVEFGMGHGNITQEILKRLSPDSRLYSFEINEEFCTHVAETIKDDRLIIVNDGAENLKKHVKTPVHQIVGSIPFSFFSKEKTAKILNDSYDILASGHYYSQALYTKFNFKKFEKVFDHCELVRISFVPQEIVYHCKKK